MSLIRLIYVAPLLLSLLWSADAAAGDYTVSYALDAGDQNDSGVTHDCKYGELC